MASNQLKTLQNCELTWLEVIMYHRWFDLIEIAKSADRLNNDGPRFLFWNALVLFQIKVKIISILVF